MSSTQTEQEVRYWLLPGEIPVGPFRVSEILNQIQAGTCTWTTRASQVGSTQWSPLNQLLTLAPLAKVADEAVTAATSQPQGTSPAIARPNPTSPNYLAIFIGTLVVGLIGYWFYSSYFAEPSLSPQQVCHAFNLARSVDAAKHLVTPNMYAALTVLFAQPDGTDDGSYELTSEQPAPPQIGGGYYVGFRAHLRDAEASILLDGVFHVVSQSGWKINDMVLVAVNQQTIQPPISMAREYEFFRDPQHPSVAQRQPNDSKRQAQQWHTSQVTNNSLRIAAATVVAKSGAGKWVASILGLIAVGLFSFFGKRLSTKPSREREVANDKTQEGQ